MVDGYREMNIQRPVLNKGVTGPVAGRIYVVGGFGGRDRAIPYEWNNPEERPKGQPQPPSDDYLDSLEAFDVNWAERTPVRDEQMPGWQSMRPLNGRRSAACGVAHGGCLWLLGGFDGVVCSNMVHVYSPQSNKWEPRKPMLEKRSGAGACVGERHIYVCGGWDGTKPLKSVERYSTTLDKWELISEMHYERSRGLGCARFGGYVWTMGGMDKNGRALNTVERYDPRGNNSMGTWEIKMQMCDRRCSCAAAVLRDNMYVIGGFNGKDALSTVERYDSLNDRWCNVRELGMPGVPAKRAWLSACTFNGRIYVVGGHDNYEPQFESEEAKEKSNEISGRCLATVECFVPELNVWQQLAPMLVTRSSLCCAALDDGYSV